MQSKRWVQSIGMIASCRWLLSGKNEQASSLQFETQDPDLGNSLSRKYRSLFLLQSRTRWEWDYPSANLSSEIMAAACGLNQTWTAAQSFNLLYPYATDETRLCRRAANPLDPLRCSPAGQNIELVLATLGALLQRDLGEIYRAPPGLAFSVS